MVYLPPFHKRYAGAVFCTIVPCLTKLYGTVNELLVFAMTNCCARYALAKAVNIILVPLCVGYANTSG